MPNFCFNSRVELARYRSIENGTVKQFDRAMKIYNHFANMRDVDDIVNGIIRLEANIRADERKKMKP